MAQERDQANLFGLAQAALKQQTEFGFSEIYFDEALPPAQRFSPTGEAIPGLEAQTLYELYDKIKNCQRCPLGASRTNLVFGSGNPQAAIVFVGEAPGRDEDLQGEPFVGRAGQLLTKIIEAMKMKREDVYIANVLKSRPPENREPLPEEIAACFPYLQKQIELIKPKFIVCLGRIAAVTLLNTKLPLGKLRGAFHDYQGIKVLVTYHPAALLRFPSYKKDVWDDMKILRKAYDGTVL